MKKIISYLETNGIFIIFPFLLYFGAKLMQIFISDLILTKFLYFYYYFFFIISIFYFLLYKTEKIVDFINKKVGKFYFIVHIVLIVIFLSLTFASYYWCIFDFDDKSFRNVTNGNFFEQYFDFFFYSIGVLLMNNNSEIVVNTSYGKLFVISEMISAFVAFVIILANYKEMKNPFNDFK